MAGGLPSDCTVTQVRSISPLAEIVALLLGMAAPFPRYPRQRQGYQDRQTNFLVCGTRNRLLGYSVPAGGVPAASQQPRKKFDTSMSHKCSSLEHFCDTVDSGGGAALPRHAMHDVVNDVSADREESLRASFIARTLPIKLPKPKTNPTIGRRYAPLGNTFLNWAPGPLVFDKAGDSGLEAVDMTSSRHSFSEFGRLDRCSSFGELDSFMQYENDIFDRLALPWRQSKTRVGEELSARCRNAVVGSARCGDVTLCNGRQAAGRALCSASATATPPLAWHSSPAAELLDMPGSADINCIEVVAQLPLTTLMVRNLPIRFTQDMLLNLWPNNGTYDLLYLPFNFRTKKNLGFAFINFVTPEFASDFRQRWHKKSSGPDEFPSYSNLDVIYAEVQGRLATLKQVSKRNKCRIRNVYFQPAIFVGDSRISMDEFMEFSDIATGERVKCASSGGDFEEMTTNTPMVPSMACC